MVKGQLLFIYLNTPPHAKARKRRRVDNGLHGGPKASNVDKHKTLSIVWKIWGCQISNP